MRKARDVDGLLRELENPRLEYQEALGRIVPMTIRERAITELQRLGSTSAVQPIAKLLADSVPTVRANAATTLGRLGDDQVGQALISALKDSNDNVRHCAARSLGHLKFRPAMSPLTSLLQDPSVWLRLTAVRALARIGDKSSIEQIKTVTRKQSWQHPSLRLRFEWAWLKLRICGGEKRPKLSNR